MSWTFVMPFASQAEQPRSSIFTATKFNVADVDCRSQSQPSCCILAACILLVRAHGTSVERRGIVSLGNVALGVIEN